MHQERPLDALNFLLADVKDGIGPFLATYLMARQALDVRDDWRRHDGRRHGHRVARAPMGILVDEIRWKRALIVGAALVVAVFAVAISAFPSFWPVVLGQAAIGTADAAFPPAVAAIRLGIVGARRFTQRVGRNEAFNHAGTQSWPLSRAWLGTSSRPRRCCGSSPSSRWRASPPPSQSVLPPSIMNARLASTGGEVHAPSGFRVILECRPLLVFTVAITLFHLANAAMLPLLGERVGA